MRSPNAGNANNARNVNSITGALNNNNANNGNGAAADCEKCPHKVSKSRNQCTHTRSGRLAPALNAEGGTHTGDVIGFRASITIPPVV